MNDLLLLSMMLGGPKYGYQLKREAGWIMGQALHNNLVYPTLRRFLEEGWVSKKAVPGERGQTRQRYVLTAEGRRYLFECLNKFSEGDASSDQSFNLRVGLFAALKPEFDLAAQFGLRLQALDTAGAQTLEPSLNPVFAHWLRIGPLRLRFIPEEPWIGWIGIAVTCLGVAVAIWARYCLGEYWSARVTLKEGHQLIRSGPYAYVRHPIYTGMLLGCVGAALVLGEWRGIMAVGLLLAAHARKALREERLLLTEFGEQYVSYRRTTGFLFPRFWSVSRMDTHPGRS